MAADRDRRNKDRQDHHRADHPLAARDAGDLIHTLSYFAWSSSAPERLSRMWTYRTVVDLLWESAPARIDSELKKRLVENLLGRAETVFSGCDAFDPGRTSLGPKSIDGVLRWLEHLVPAVVLDNRMQRRQRCSPAMMALALAATAREAGVEAGTDFRLGPDQRSSLGRACFLDPNALDAMLVWTVQTRPQSVRWGTMNARYGRQLVLHDLSPLL